jgi:hypothetical protein
VQPIFFQRFGVTCLHVPEIVQLVSDFLESADRNILRAVNLTAAHTLSLHLARWPQLLRRLIRGPFPAPPCRRSPTSWWTWTTPAVGTATPMPSTPVSASFVAEAFPRRGPGT